MPVCKLCNKLFSLITPSHVKKAHGFNSLDEYKKATKNIVVPEELQKQDDIAEARRKKQRSEKMRKKTQKKKTVDNMDIIVDVKSNVENNTLNSVLQAGFANSRKNK